MKAFPAIGLVAALAAGPAHADLVRVEDIPGLVSGDSIEAKARGFGSNGGFTVNWDPEGDPATALRVARGGYSGRDAAWCMAGVGCALELRAGTRLDPWFLQIFSFRLGAAGDTDRVIAYSVTDLETGLVIASGAPVVPAAAGLVVPLDPPIRAVSEVGFRIAFGPDGSLGGINDVAFALGVVDRVPAPASLALFGLALAGLALARRRTATPLPGP